MTTYSNPPIPKLPGYVVNMPVSFFRFAAFSARCLRTGMHVTLSLLLPLSNPLATSAWQRGRRLDISMATNVKTPSERSRTYPRLDATAGSQVQSPSNTGTFSPTKSGMFVESPSKLPQWVENDRKVRVLFFFEDLQI
jgi:hypothetical protein